MDMMIVELVTISAVLFAILAVVSFAFDRRRAAASRRKPDAEPSSVVTITSDRKREESPRGEKVPWRLWWVALPARWRWAVLGGVAVALLAGGFLAVRYFWTAGERLEAEAVESLRGRASVEGIDVEGPEVIPLHNGQWWAMRKGHVFYTKWDYLKTDSPAFPYRATITLWYEQYATVSHASQADAEQDKQFYPFLGEHYYPTPEGYRDNAPLLGGVKRKSVTKLLYDRSRGAWVDQGTETSWSPGGR